MFIQNIKIKDYFAVFWVDFISVRAYNVSKFKGFWEISNHSKQLQHFLKYAWKMLILLLFLASDISFGT